MLTELALKHWSQDWLGDSHGTGGLPVDPEAHAGANGCLLVALAQRQDDQAGVEVGRFPQVGFLRADAQRLPLRDETVDAVVSIAVLMLIPDPVAVLAEMARVLRPGGRLAFMVPTAGRAARYWRKLLPITGSSAFGED